MKTVWVVEQGEYSGYHVVGVFSTKENAELCMNEVNRRSDDKATIAEWPLDPAVEALRAGLRHFNVRMFRDGTADWAVEDHYRDSDSEFDLHAGGPVYKNNALDYIYPPYLNAQVWAKDEQHAIKIANEKRAQMIATGEWKDSNGG